MFAPWTQTEEPEPQKPSNPSVADQLKKIGERNERQREILDKYYPQDKKADERYWKVYDEWKWLLRHIPGLSRGTLEGQMIAQARDPSIPKDWPKGSETRSPVTWKVPPDRKDGQYFPYRQP